MEDIAITEVVKACIKTISFKTVTNTDTLIESGILDSISLIDLATSLEEAFSIQIPLVDINKQQFATVLTIAHYIKAKLG